MVLLLVKCGLVVVLKIRFVIKGTHIAATYAKGAKKVAESISVESINAVAVVFDMFNVRKVYLLGRYCCSFKYFM